MQAVRTLREWFDSEQWDEGWRRRVKDSAQCVGCGFIVGCGLSTLRFGTNNHENSSFECKFLGTLNLDYVDIIVFLMHCWCQTPFHALPSVWPVLFGCGVGFGLALISLETPALPVAHRVPQIFDDSRFDSYAGELREQKGARKRQDDGVNIENRKTQEDGMNVENRKTLENRKIQDDSLQESRQTRENRYQKEKIPKKRSEDTWPPY